MDPNTTNPTAAPRPGEDADGPPATRERRQRAGFSVFFDVAAGDDDGRLETRIYHDESGAEVVFAGAEPAVWSAWMVERIGRDDVTIGPAYPAPAIVTLDASIAVPGAPSSRARNVRVSLRSDVDGPADLERALGAAFVRAIAQLLEPGR